MKKLTVLLIFVTTWMSAFTQTMPTPTGLSYDAVKRQVEKSNEKIQHPRKSQKARIWANRGDIFQDAHDVDIQFLRVGMPDTESQLYLKNPDEVITEERNGATVEKHVFDRVTLIFQNDVLIDWKKTEKLHPNPLDEALEAYKKALELDQDKYADRLEDNFTRLKEQYEADAILDFSNKRYEQALHSFEKIIELQNTPVYPEDLVDTLTIYNAALAAANAGIHDKSIKYFKKSIENNYGGSDAYYLLKREYIAKGDSMKAIKTLEDGFGEYPDTTLLLFEIVNYYLSAQNAEKGLKYLKMAEEEESDNPSIYFAKGTMYETTGKDKEAEEAYKEAIEVDPEYFNAWFNLGAMYFNQAVEMYVKANEIQDVDEYNAARKEADKVVRKALEPLENAHELKPDDVATMETLQTIYYRLQMQEKYEEISEKLAKAKAQ